jgi:hypothetical protein
MMVGKTPPSAHHSVATHRRHEETARSVPRYAEIQEVVHLAEKWPWMSWPHGAVLGVRPKAGTCERVKTLPDHRTT